MRSVLAVTVGAANLDASGLKRMSLAFGALWDAGESKSEIARRFETTPHIIERELLAQGIQPYFRGGQARGKRHGGWKGGRVSGTAGYVFVRINGRYVSEHRLVMSQALGRPLSKGETVHHINGDKADNRLENLQLRVGNHGKGGAFRCIDCGSSNVQAVKLSG